MKMNRMNKIVVAILALAPLIATAVAYRYLPDQVPVHWNIDGTVSYGARWNMFALGSLNLLLAILFPLLPKIDPRRENYLKFQKHYDMFLIGIMLFGGAVWSLSMYQCFAPEAISMNRVVAIGLSLLFIFVGNLLPKIKNNFFMGIKNPWTLSSDDVWNKTHRLAGFLFVIAGAVSLAGSFLLSNQIVIWLMLGAILGAVLIPTVMSYLWFRKIV